MAEPHPGVPPPPAGDVRVDHGPADVRAGVAGPYGAPAAQRPGERLLDQVFGFARVACQHVTEAEQARQGRGDEFAEAVAAEVRADQPSSVINLTSRQLATVHRSRKLPGQLQSAGAATYLP